MRTKDLPDVFLASNGRREGSFHQAPLPNDLLEAETVLTALASVFLPAETPPGKKDRALVEELAWGETEWPGVKDTYRILVEQIPAVVFLAFFEQGIGEAYVSPQIERTLGFTQAEWLEDPVRWYQQIHPDDKARWSVEAARMFLTGEPLRSVYRVLARDGRVVWFHCEVKMVRHADGRPWFIHGVGFDITDLKQTEEALSRSEEMLRGIFEYAPDTMVVVGHDGRIERVNAQVELMFGYRRDELIGQPVEVLLPERFRQGHVERRAGYVADPHVRPMGVGLTLHGRRRDGAEFPVEIMLSPVEAASNGMVIVVVRDITRRQRDEVVLREYAERMKVLSRGLIAVQEAERRRLALELHDEIGQILTGLKLKLEMSARLAQDAANENLAEAQSLVNELMARTRKLSLDLRPATLDHLGLLSALLRHIRQYTSQTQVRVDFRHSGLEGRRFAPELETAAFRIVQEALTNVARHSGAREAMVRIWADQHALAVQVEDRGKGFDLPAHGEAAAAARESSGLTGMRERALLLGGHFAIESHPGGGTSLTAEWSFDDNLGSSYYDGWENAETFVKQDPLGNPIDQNHPWNQTTIPRPQKRDFNGNYTWVMSPRWLDKRTGEHLALDTGGGPIARLWATALAGQVDIGYIKATGNSVKIYLPKTAMKPEVEFEWKIPKWSNAIERDRARTYFQAYAAAAALHFAEQAMAELHAGHTKTWNEFKVPEEAIGCGFHEAVRGVLSHHVVIRDGKIANYHPYPPTPWNANPRDIYGTPGPYEDAVQNTPIFEENGPDKFKVIDIMRAVRSFDPCLPCGVHMYLGNGKVLETRHSPMFGVHG